MGSVDWQRAFEDSASSLTTLGFSEPSSTAKIVVAFVEATLGLGLVALLISYLPTIYSAYNGRERGVITLSPIAGVPPTVPVFLQTLHRTGALDGQDFWRRQTDWLIDAEQTHTSFPILTYFPDAHPDLSWVASIGVVLDAAALLVSASEATQVRSWPTRRRGLSWCSSTAPPPSTGSPAPPTCRSPLPSAWSSHDSEREPPPRSASPARNTSTRSAASPRSSGSPTATRTRGGAGSPGSAPPTTNRCAAGGHRHGERRRHGRRIARRTRRPGRAGPRFLPAPTRRGSQGAGLVGRRCVRPYRWLKPPDSSLVMGHRDGVAVEVRD